MSDTPVPTRRDVEEQLVARAWADDGFRGRLKADPHAAVLEATGITVPQSITIEVVEETAEKGYLVIPVNRVAISDEDLEAAIGGNGYTDPVEGPNIP
jgi:hypothetical protein